MAKKKGEENSTPMIEQTDGHNLLGSPSFVQLENGRFKCLETGHELPAQNRDSYSVSKHCRIGLIDSALARNNPPLNMFRQDPLSRSKLICKLTGVTVNKTEEHIWKHMNGKRFLSVLEKKEKEKEMPNATTSKQNEKNEKKKKVRDDRSIDEMISEVRDSAGTSSDSDNEAFWMPPVRERRDNDEGDERSVSSGSGPESDDFGDEEAGSEEAKLEAGKLSIQTKRMTLEIGPSSFASRKKKKKTSEE